MGLGDIHRAAKIMCDTQGVDAAYLLDHFYSNQKKTTDKTTHLPASAFWRSLRFITTQKIVFDTAPPSPLLPTTLYHSATQCNTVQHTKSCPLPPRTTPPHFPTQHCLTLSTKSKQITSLGYTLQYTRYILHTCIYMYIHMYIYLSHNLLKWQQSGKIFMEYNVQHMTRIESQGFRIPRLLLQQLRVKVEKVGALSARGWRPARPDASNIINPCKYDEQYMP